VISSQPTHRRNHAAKRVAARDASTSLSMTERVNILTINPLS
jgi:hypothetical protein